MTHLRHILKTLAALSFLCAWAGSAAASPEYPAALRKATDAPCPPPCTVCHLTMNGGTGTALKPFAESMIDVGQLEGEDESLIGPAVSALESNKTDSDGDGVEDITELGQGRDPNVTGAGDLCGPKYGCGARVEPDGGLDLTASVLALGVVALLLIRRRRA